MTTAMGEVQGFLRQVLAIEGRLAAEDPPATDWPTTKTELLAVLQRQTEEAARQGVDILSDDYLDRRLLRAALGDQRFGSFERPGWQEAWAASPLIAEDSLRPSGELQRAMLDEPASGILDALQTTLDRNDPRQVELVQIYLAVLALGVPGVLFPSVPGGDCDADAVERTEAARASRIEQLRSESLAYLYRHSPDLATGGPLFPEAYSRSSGAGPTGRLPSVKAWQWASMAALLAMLWLSWHTWHRATQDARQGAQAILEMPLATAP